MSPATTIWGISMRIAAPLDLPNGSRLPNRVAKAAMEESLAVQPGQLPGPEIEALYRRWAEGGAGLIITGNVMVDRRALTSPRTIVLDSATPLEPFRRWAAAAGSGGGQVWMQINHPGRQVRADLPGVAWAPSEVAVSLGKHTALFARPRAMDEADIEATVARFATTAGLAEEAGFHGVQIHAAHGYLLSQFLSPLVNRRTDRWGGELENRARLLVEIVKAVRARVSPGFAVGIKINTADFQRGGFDVEDVARVLGLVADLGVDLVELSGGSVESAATMGRTADETTLDREAYFLGLAERLVATSTVPLMLTGGICRSATAERVLDRGFAVAGVATALALHPDLPARWTAGEDVHAPPPRLGWRDQDLASAAILAIVRAHLTHLARGRTGTPRLPARLTFIRDTLTARRAVRAYGTWLASSPAPEPTRAGTPAPETHTGEVALTPEATGTPEAAYGTGLAGDLVPDAAQAGAATPEALAGNAARAARISEAASTPEAVGTPGAPGTPEAAGTPKAVGTA
ncbi:NADH:flavin oxidoreductase/NADH oxidase family protein [Streptomyces sp. NPDC047014]|uniref:NADH:flavin oxidoreductase/NADH oxidase family protein n=1 Tax=Streptomyces sp. NPDC047014 TaxID=3155736 RepID=UPI0033D297C7